jgi:hypothetical protein
MVVDIDWPHRGTAMIVDNLISILRGECTQKLISNSDSNENLNTLRTAQWSDWLRWGNSYLDTIYIDRSCTHDRYVPIWVATLNAFKSPAKPCYNVTGFGGDQELSRATPRTTTKGHKGPIWTKTEPSLWFEVIRIIAPNLFVSVHDALVNLYNVTPLDIDWGLPILATTEWKRSVSKTITDLHNSIGIKAMC